MSKPQQFFTGRQVLEFYIPDYGTKDQVTTVDTEVEHSVTKIMSKIDLRDKLPTPQHSKSDTSQER